jgi:hypothetical protein
MFVKMFGLGLVTVATLGGTALAAFADTASVQTNTQDVYIEGVRNRALQDNQQSNRLRTRNYGASDGDQGIVQDSLQRTEIYGRSNQSEQRSTQANISEIMNRARRAR